MIICRKTRTTADIGPCPGYLYHEGNAWLGPPQSHDHSLVLLVDSHGATLENLLERVPQTPRVELVKAKYHLLYLLAFPPLLGGKLLSAVAKQTLEEKERI